MSEQAPNDPVAEPSVTPRPPVDPLIGCTLAGRYQVPRHLPSLRASGPIYMRRRQWEAAEAIWRNVLELTSGTANADDLANARWEAGKMSGAELRAFTRVSIDGDTVVWDSLAIIEYLADTYAGVWPADAKARAWSRSAPMPRCISRMR